MNTTHIPVFPRPGLHQGVTVRDMAAGERIVCALTTLFLIEPFNGTNPYLQLSVGGVIIGAFDLAAMPTNEVCSGVHFVQPDRPGWTGWGDIVWTKNGPPLVMSIADPFGADPETTTGAATLVLTTDTTLTGGAR